MVSLISLWFWSDGIGYRYFAVGIWNLTIQNWTFRRSDFKWSSFQRVGLWSKPFEIRAISNGFWQNGSYLSRLQMVLLPDFKSHFITLIIRNISHQPSVFLFGKTRLGKETFRIKVLTLSNSQLIMENRLRHTKGPVHLHRVHYIHYFKFSNLKT